MLFFSLTSVNKEILGFAGFVLAGICIERGAAQYGVLALALAALARWPQCVLLAVFQALWWMTRRLSLPRQSMYVCLAIGLLLGSIAFPLLHDLLPLQRALLMERALAANQMQRAHGILASLNALQDGHWYGMLVSIGPKTLLQWVGNIFRVGPTLSGRATDVDYKDIYNTYVILGHQLWMTAALVALVLRRASLTSSTMQLVVWYALFVASLPYINYRLMFPLVGLLAIQLAAPSQASRENR